MFTGDRYNSSLPAPRGDCDLSRARLRLRARAGAGAVGPVGTNESASWGLLTNHRQPGSRHRLLVWPKENWKEGETPSITERIQNFNEGISILLAAEPR